jgi:hypothetical protein
LEAICGVTSSRTARHFIFELELFFAGIQGNEGMSANCASTYKLKFQIFIFSWYLFQEHFLGEGLLPITYWPKQSPDFCAKHIHMLLAEVMVRCYGRLGPYTNGQAQ